MFYVHDINCEITISLRYKAKLRANRICRMESRVTGRAVIVLVQLESRGRWMAEPAQSSNECNSLRRHQRSSEPNSHRQAVGEDWANTSRHIPSAWESSWSLSRADIKSVYQVSIFQSFASTSKLKMIFFQLHNFSLLVRCRETTGLWDAIVYVRHNRWA